MHRRSILWVAAAGPAIAGTLLLLIVGLAAGAPVAREGPEGSLGTGSSTAADLDGDGELEQVSLGTGRGGIAIVDGDTRYVSRPRWWVTVAAIADADRNGLPEVTALLDADDGRHLGLIGWHRGAYRERLVSSVLPLRPAALEVRDAPELGGWVVELTEIPARPARRADPDAPRITTTYRWNGFGFIAIAGEGAAHDEDSHRQP